MDHLGRLRRFFGQFSWNFSLSKAMTLMSKLLKLLCFHDVLVVVMFFVFSHSSLKCLQVEDRREETIWLPSSELRPFFWCLKAINKLAIKNTGVLSWMVQFIGGIKVWTWPPLWAAGCDELTRYSSLCSGRWLCGEFYMFLVPFLIWIMKWEIEIFPWNLSLPLS